MVFRAYLRLLRNAPSTRRGALPNSASQSETPRSGCSIVLDLRRSLQEQKLAQSVLASDISAGMTEGL
jgi:hypothetical protein